MKLYHHKVFDDYVTGTGTTWYSSGDYNSILGDADAIVVGAVTTSVTGTSPTLTVEAEHSGDAANWQSVGSPAITIISSGIVNDAALVGELTGVNVVLLPFVRLKVTLAGTSPQCRLKLYATGRAAGNRTQYSAGFSPPLR